jgi:hypothetical protein
MNLPDGRLLILESGVLPEQMSVDGRIIFWLAGATEKGFRQWERIGSVAHAGFVTERGIRSTAATAVPARQWVGGSFQGLLKRRGGSGKERVWTLPDGGIAEQSDARRTDLVLAWSEIESEPLGPERIRVCWPNAGEAREIGPNVYLVSGVEEIRSAARVTPDSSAGDAGSDQPRRHAEVILAEARARGDARRVMLALADLGLALIHERNARGGSELLEESLAEARRLGDQDQETNVMIDLGLASLSATQPGRAKEFLVPRCPIPAYPIPF